MFAAIFGNLFSALTNPSVLILLIGTFGVTQIWSRVSGFFETKAAVATYQEAVASRDQAAVIKDGIQQAAIKQRGIDDAKIKQLTEALTGAQAQLSLKTDVACQWTVPERQLLNGASSISKRK